MKECKLYTIRKDALNLTLDKWAKFNAAAPDGVLKTTVEDFYKLVGFSGGMVLGCKTNWEESEFFDEFYRYGNSIRKMEIVDGCRPFLTW